MFWPSRKPCWIPIAKRWGCVSIMARAGFANRLNTAIQTTGTVLCAGIDPHLDLMPPVFGGPDQALGSPAALAHLREFSLAVIAAAAGNIPAIKPIRIADVGPTTLHPAVMETNPAKIPLITMVMSILP